MAVDVGSVYRIRLELYTNEFLSVADIRMMAAHTTGDFLRFGKEVIFSFRRIYGPYYFWFRLCNVDRWAQAKLMHGGEGTQTARGIARRANDILPRYAIC